MAFRRAGSGSGVASFSGSAGGASGGGFLVPAAGGQVTPAEARPPLHVLPEVLGRIHGISRGLHPTGLSFLNQLVSHLLVTSFGEMDRVRPP